MTTLKAIAQLGQILESEISLDQAGVPGLVNEFLPVGAAAVLYGGFGAFSSTVIFGK